MWKLIALPLALLALAFLIAVGVVIYGVFGLPAFLFFLAVVFALMASI